jgi:hypothetical protein
MMAREFVFVTSSSLGRTHLQFQKLLSLIWIEENFGGKKE